MQSFSLKCHPWGAAALPSSFFLLSKGKNAGKPAHAPYRNCFVLTCPPGEYNLFYWIVYAIWETGGFLPCLHGTAIPTVRIGDIRKVICSNLANARHLAPILPALASIRQLEDNYSQQIIKLDQLRRAMVQEATRKGHSSEAIAPDLAPLLPPTLTSIFSHHKNTQV